MTKSFVFCSVVILASCLGCCSNKSSDLRPESTSAPKTTTSVHAADPPTATEAARNPAPASNTLQFKTYKNARFAFTVDHPSHFHASPPPDNGDGQEWTWHGSSMVASGGNNATNETLDSRFASEKARSGVTGAFKKQGYFIVTGKDNGRIFYEKQYVTKDLVLTLLFDYPEAMKSEFDPIVTKAAETFRPLN